MKKKQVTCHEFFHILYTLCVRLFTVVSNIPICKWHWSSMISSMMEVFDRFMNIQTPIYHISDSVVIQVLHFHLTSQLPDLLQRNRNMVLWILQYHIISITILKRKKPQSNSRTDLHNPSAYLQQSRPFISQTTASFLFTKEQVYSCTCSCTITSISVRTSRCSVSSAKNFIQVFSSGFKASWWNCSECYAEPYTSSYCGSWCSQSTTSYVRDQSLPCWTGDCTSKPNISEWILDCCYTSSLIFNSISGWVLLNFCLTGGHSRFNDNLCSTTSESKPGMSW